MINCFSTWQVWNERVVREGGGVQAAAGPMFATAQAWPLFLLNKAQLLYVCHNQWDDISELVITKKDSCWCLLELPIFRVALGSFWEQCVCCWLLISLLILELKGRFVWRLVLRSLVLFSFPPSPEGIFKNITETLKPSACNTGWGVYWGKGTSETSMQTGVIGVFTFCGAKAFIF